MLLHKDKDVFQELIIATASDLGLENFQVEKDYYVSLFLKELSKQESNISIVFIRRNITIKMLSHHCKRQIHLRHFGE